MVLYALGCWYCGREESGCSGREKGVCGMDTRFESVLARLESVRQSNGGWSCKCPAHDDHRASLRVWLADSGDLRLKCFAGCGFKEVLAALGLTTADVSAEGKTRAREIAHYDYRDETGELLFQVVRFEPKDFRQRVPVNGGWQWGLQGARRVLYRLTELVKYTQSKVLVVEGEKDADRLAKEGFLGTCNPMGAGKWHPDYTRTLTGRTVVLIPDNDKAGEEHVAAVYRSLLAVATVAVVRLAPAKDVSDWLNAGHTAAELKELCNEALKTAEVLHNLSGLDRQAKWSAIRQLTNELESSE